MPTPQKNEKKTDYVNRCMSYDEMVQKHPDEKQRYAICNSMWQQHKTKAWFDTMINKNINQHEE